MNAQLLEELIAGGETTTLELKIAPPRPSEMAERICGMANGAGGYVVIGVADKTWEIVGVRNEGEAVDNIMQSIRLCKPSVRLDPEQPEAIEIKGRKVVVAYILPNDGTLYQSGNTFWIRRGTNTISFSGMEIKDFLYRTGSLNWEALPIPSATLADLDQGLIDRYLQQRLARGANPKRMADQVAVLITIGCAKITQDRQGQEVIRPTNAGMVLFGDTPQDFIRHSEVVCVLFSDQTGLRRYRDRRILNGTLTQQVTQIEAFLTSNLKMSAEMRGFHRVDLPDYPIEALREAVVNALVHRDYSIAGETIRIFYFPDRIEIHSPGLLMPGINLESLKRGQFLSKPRNTVLCDVMKDLPGNYMERMGSGIKFMVDIMRELGKPEPAFREEGEFIVTFWNGIESNPPVQSDPELPVAVANTSQPTPTNLDITPTSTPFEITLPTKAFPSYIGDDKLEPSQRQERAIRYVQHFGSITNKEYRRITGTSERGALRDLEDLVRNGSLRASGEKRNRKYLL
ncbi:MAG: ATP-binding protein [Chloroflexota bacterium]|nr:putative DNA binding domain-containing protein [Chloroflexota bacterium]